MDLETVMLELEALGKERMKKCIYPMVRASQFSA